MAAAFWEEAGLRNGKGLAAVAALAIALVLTPAAPRAEEPSAAALEFVGLFSDRHLSGMLSRIGARQPQMLMLGQAGGRLTETVFNDQIDMAVAKYGDAWQRNMALSWDGLLDDEAFASLTAEGAESPYQAQYLSLRGAAGQAMQGLSQDLFRDILAEVIDETSQVLTVDEAGTATSQ